MVKKLNPLHIAILRGEMETVKRLLAEGASINQPIGEEGTPLHYAVEYGKTSIVQLLIEKGAACDARGGKWQETPLMLAAQKGRTPIAQALIAAGADLSLTTTHGVTALVYASGDKGDAWFKIVQDLIRAGADANQQCPKGMTALIEAARKAGPETIRALIAAGGNVNAVTGWGTPLIRAVSNKRADNVLVLLQAGADPHLRIPPDLRDKAVAGRTPLELAREMRLKKIIALLEAGPNQSPPHDVNQLTAANIRPLWKRIENTLKKTAPALKASLRPAAGDAEIQAVETRCNAVLPEDFKASYHIHDGQKPDGDGIIVPAFAGEEYALLTLEGIVAEWAVWKALIDSGEFAREESTPDQGIRSDWWRPAWIPFASNGGGDSLCIDLAPTESGNLGQVISMNHDSAKRELLATSFAQYLSLLAECLENDSSE